MPCGGSMTILSRSFLAIAVILSLRPSAFAQKPDCPTPLGDRADVAEDRVSDWNDLMRWHRRYAACDDGETAEGIDDKVAMLFGTRWAELMRTAPAFEKNAALRRFLLRHIDVVGMSAEQARELGRRSRTDCPPANIPLCRDIAREADATVREATQ